MNTLIMIIVLAVLAALMGLGGWYVHRRKNDEIEEDYIAKQEAATQLAIQRMTGGESSFQVQSVTANVSPTEDELYKQALAQARAKKQLDAEEEKRKKVIQNLGKRLQSSSYLRAAKRNAFYKKGVAVRIPTDAFRKLLYTDWNGLTFYTYNLEYTGNRIIDTNTLKVFELAPDTPKELFDGIDLIVYGKKSTPIIDTHTGLILPDPNLTAMSSCILEVVEGNADVEHASIVELIYNAICGDGYRLESIDMMDSLIDDFTQNVVDESVRTQLIAAIHQRKLEWSDEIENRESMLRFQETVRPSVDPTEPAYPSAPADSAPQTFASTSQMLHLEPPEEIKPVEMPADAIASDPEPEGSAPEDEENDEDYNDLLAILNSGAKASTTDPDPVTHQTPREDSEEMTASIQMAVEATEGPLGAAEITPYAQHYAALNAADLEAHPDVVDYSLPGHLQEGLPGRDATDDLIDMVNRNTKEGNLPG